MIVFTLIENYTTFLLSSFVKTQWDLFITIIYNFPYTQLPSTRLFVNKYTIFYLFIFLFKISSEIRYLVNSQRIFKFAFTNLFAIPSRHITTQLQIRLVHFICSPASCTVFNFLPPSLFSLIKIR